MNYRHAFHAGNFADVLKHAVLALCIEHLKLKPAPFRVIDTHAGAGRYDLASTEAARTGEWRDGIGRLVGPHAPALPADIARLLAPWLDVVRAGMAVTPAAPAISYPGSPLLALALLRREDRLIANELHPDDRERLIAALARDPRAKVLGIDGWQALKALLPPKERRGVVLVDPPFEENGELERLAQGLEAAAARFATGIFLLWYPVKDRAAVRAFHARLAGLGLPKLLTVELDVGTPSVAGRLQASGLAVLNPPHRLESQLAVLLPILATRLAQGPGAHAAQAWLAPPRR